MSSDNHIAERTREVVREHLARLVRPGTEIDDDTAIFSSGLVDSLGVLEFVAALERGTGTPVRPIDITLENLDTIGRIVRLFEGYASAGA